MKSTPVKLLSILIILTLFTHQSGVGHLSSMIQARNNALRPTAAAIPFEPFATAAAQGSTRFIPGTALSGVTTSSPAKAASPGDRLNENLLLKEQRSLKEHFNHVVSRAKVLIRKYPWFFGFFGFVFIADWALKIYFDYKLPGPEITHHSPIIATAVAIIGVIPLYIRAFITQTVDLTKTCLDLSHHYPVYWFEGHIPAGILSAVLIYGTYRLMASNKFFKGWYGQIAAGLAGAAVLGNTISMAITGYFVNWAKIPISGTPTLVSEEVVIDGIRQFHVSHVLPAVRVNLADMAGAAIPAFLFFGGLYKLIQHRSSIAKGIGQAFNLFGRWLRSTTASIIASFKRTFYSITSIPRAFTATVFTVSILAIFGIFGCGPDTPITAGTSFRTSGGNVILIEPDPNFPIIEHNYNPLYWVHGDPNDSRGAILKQLTHLLWFEVTDQEGNPLQQPGRRDINLIPGKDGGGYWHYDCLMGYRGRGPVCDPTGSPGDFWLSRGVAGVLKSDPPHGRNRMYFTLGKKSYPSLWLNIPAPIGTYVVYEIRMGTMSLGYIKAWYYKESETERTNLAETVHWSFHWYDTRPGANFWIFGWDEKAAVQHRAMYGDGSYENPFKIRLTPEQIEEIQRTPPLPTDEPAEIDQNIGVSVEDIEPGASFLGAILSNNPIIVNSIELWWADPDGVLVRRHNPSQGLYPYSPLPWPTPAEPNGYVSPEEIMAADPNFFEGLYTLVVVADGEFIEPLSEDPHPDANSFYSFAVGELEGIPYFPERLLYTVTINNRRYIHAISQGVLPMLYQWPLSYWTRGEIMRNGRPARIVMVPENGTIRWVNPKLPGDADMSGRVDIYDLAGYADGYLASWYDPVTYPDYNPHFDLAEPWGYISLPDLAAMAQYWLVEVDPPYDTGATSAPEMQEEKAQDTIGDAVLPITEVISGEKDIPFATTGALIKEFNTDVEDPDDLSFALKVLLELEERWSEGRREGLTLPEIFKLREKYDAAIDAQKPETFDDAEGLQPVSSRSSSAGSVAAVLKAELATDAQVIKASAIGVPRAGSKAPLSPVLPAVLATLSLVGAGGLQKEHNVRTATDGAA